MINIDIINIAAGTQSRAEINEQVVNDYVEAIQNGSIFPPVQVYSDGVNYYLVDGFHRYHAHRRLKKKAIDADVLQGTLRDAILHSLGANALHGLRRTNEDKRKAVMTMLEDIEWQDWSDNEIARNCKVSAPLVAKIRKDIGAEKTTRKFKSKTGKTSEIKIEPKEEVDLEKDAVDDLLQENESLKDQLAVAKLGSTPDATMAQETIESLREEVRILRIENESLRISRDTFQNENAQLKKQIAMMKK
jgi:ParB-like chromosome segregation protein Spo0J